MLYEIQRRPAWALGITIGLIVGWTIFEIYRIPTVLSLSDIAECIIAFGIGLCISIVWGDSPKWKLD